MKLLLDENLPFSFVENLTELGFSVEHVRMVGLRGKSDTEIASYAKQHSFIIITKDIEFGSLVVHPVGTHHSVIILRLSNLFKKDQIFTVLKRFLLSAKEEELIKSISIVQLGKYRIRKGVV